MAARLPVRPALAGPEDELMENRLPGAGLLSRSGEDLGVCRPPQIDAVLAWLSFVQVRIKF
jgi:hypothetical protein